MKKYNTIRQILTQFILIVFSVVLGLYLSERIEERKKQKESDVLLSKLKSEVTDNIKLLEDWVPYHQEINQNLDSLIDDTTFIEAFVNDKYAFYETLFTRGTFMAMFPTNDAWEIAKSHPLIVNVDYDKLLILSRIYSQQENTFEPGFKMFDVLNSKGINKKEEAKSNLALLSGHMKELIAREKDLLFFCRKGEVALNVEEDGDK
ncbi:MAG: hypothetical protein AAF206_16585 [Bacteroidota bacterium]